MILILNYDSKQTSNPQILEKGLFIVPKTFTTLEEAEGYLLSSPKLPFDICKMVNIDHVPQDLSVPQEAQIWLNTILGREESFVPVELMERRGNCDKCVFGSAFKDWEWEHEN